MKWEEEGYTRKDESGQIISIVRSPTLSSMQWILNVLI